MADVGLKTWFAALPEKLRIRLALGSCGKLHLLDMAGAGFAAAGQSPETARACADMLLSAWGASPISGDLAGMLLASPILAPLLDEKSRALLRHVNRLWRRPDNLDYYLRLASSRRFDKLLRYLESQVDKEPDNLYWHEQALILGLFQGDYQWAVSLMERGALQDLGPCLTSIRCQAALLAGDATAALGLSGSLDDTFGSGYAETCRARASSSSSWWISTSGVMGDPTKASAAKGERIWETMVAHLVALVEDLKNMTLEDIYHRRY